MSFRKQLPQKPVPTVREMVTKYGDEWYLFCASHPISSAVFRGDMQRCDYYDALRMKRCEKGEIDRVDDWDLSAADERLPVQVDFVHPPIPDRSCDYAAYRDPEPGNPVGRGRTPFLAINDLIEQESE
jgi:hypothetical protein